MITGLQRVADSLHIRSFRCGRCKHVEQEVYGVHEYGGEGGHHHHHHGDDDDDDEDGSCGDEDGILEGAGDDVAPLTSSLERDLHRQ
jgi:hypothetical protein